jgi:hypothetical protein
MSNDRQLHQFYGLFPTLLLNRETEEMMHDEGLLARFWGVWFDSCMACWDKMASDAVNETRCSTLWATWTSMWWPMMRR